VIIICILSRRTIGNHLEISIPMKDESIGIEDLEICCEDTVQLSSREIRDGRLILDLEPVAEGAGSLEIRTSEGELIREERFEVSGHMTVREDETGNFTGDGIIAGTLSIFFLTAAFLMLRFYFRTTGSAAFYSYNTIFAVGMAAFSGMTGFMLLFLYLRHIISPEGFPMRSVYSMVSRAGVNFVFLTTPLVVAFAGMLIVSNIALLRHERYRFRNILGLLIGLVMLVGLALVFILDRYQPASMHEMRIYETVLNIYGTVFTYFECMLAGSVVCGLQAAMHKPDYDRDFIIILGCRVRQDGTLTPLLKCRVDEALRFRNEQMAVTGKKALLIPSGGQGPDETIAEAEGMSRYLVERGVPERDILKETRSVNTYQNMEFSKRIIDATKPGAKTAFCTTNYHVFRSGVWSAYAGLYAEGFGCGTKWWFWPNAFMRECIGLLQKKLVQEIILLAALAAFFGALTYLQI
jgi:vancomycin permeability regulator SanA